MPAPSPNPLPLTRGQQAGRLIIASVLGVVGWFSQFAVDTDPATWVPLVDLLLGIGAIVLLAHRRRWPFAVAIILVAATALSAMALPAAFIALVSLTTTRRWRAVAVTVLTGMLSLWVWELLSTEPDDGLPWWALPLTALLLWSLAVGIGVFVSTRRALAQSYRDRAETAEREQQARVEQARLGERTRIAREMHDVLAHRISLLALHAGAMTYRDDLTRDELRDAAAVVEQNARQAMADLRGVLGVLRDPTSGPDPEERSPEPPQPTLADLSALVQETRAAGSPVTVHDHGVPTSALPVTVSRTAYRIVQEALTNARKHAPGAPVVIELGRGGDGWLELVVINPLVGGGRVELPGSGVGLIGLAERAAALGGELSHGIGPDGSFVLRVRLPVAAGDPAVVS